MCPALPFSGCKRCDDAMGWMGVSFVVLPCLCLLLSLCLFAWGIIRRRERPCGRLFLWAGILLACPVLLALLLFLAGALGAGPVTA